MIDLQYTLTADEAVSYYEMIGAGSQETRMARGFAAIWVPAFLTALIIALKLYNSVLWIMSAVFLSFFWITFLAPRMYRDVARTAAKRKIEKDKSQFSAIHVELNNDILTVNGENKKIKTFVTYYNLIVIAFQDGSNLLLPERAFGNDSQKMEEFLTYLVRNSDKAE